MCSVLPPACRFFPRAVFAIHVFGLSDDPFVPPGNGSLDPFHDDDDSDDDRDCDDYDSDDNDDGDGEGDGGDHGHCFHQSG